MKDIQNEVKYLHERISESIDENRLKFKLFSEELNEKMANLGVTSTNETFKKFTDLREEMERNFTTVNNHFTLQLGVVKTDNVKLISENYEKVQSEINRKSIELNKYMQDLMDEERKVRTTKDTEITGFVRTTKSMLVEKINTLNESTQALIRALVNEEAADRAKSIENLTATFRIRTDSMDKFFKDLIQTSVEQSKLHLTDFIKRVDIKVEEHKVWTARQINVLIKDVEEYILSQTVLNFREELFHKCSDKERLEQWNQIEEAFQVVGAKFEELDIQKKEDFDGVEKKFSETLGRMNYENEVGRNFNSFKLLTKQRRYSRLYKSLTKQDKMRFKT